MKKFLKRLHDFLEKKKMLPSYDEDAIFLLALAVIVISAIDVDARVFIQENIFGRANKLSLLIPLGIFFSIYTAFFVKFKTITQKHYMFWFAISMNMVSVIAYLSLTDVQKLPFYAYIMMAISLLITILMGVFWRAKLIDINVLPNKSSSYSNIIYGSIFLLLFVFLAKYILDFNWITTLSFSTAYATILNKYVSGHLPKIFRKKDNDMATIELCVNNGVERMLQSLNEHDSFSAFIISGFDIKRILINSENIDNIEELLITEARKFSEQSGAVSIITLSEIMEKRNMFSKKSDDTPAIVVAVYLKGQKNGHMFAQKVETNNLDEYIKKNSLIYINKNKNLLFS